MGSLKNEKTWEPHEGDVIETYDMLYKELVVMVAKINTYWYAGNAKNQSVRILCRVLERLRRDTTWEEDAPVDRFEELVAMYINDCMQYLKRTQNCRGGVEFDPTTEQDKIFDGLRELKDLCMKQAGVEPVPWELLVKKEEE